VHGLREGLPGRRLSGEKLRSIRAQGDEDAG